MIEDDDSLLVVNVARHYFHIPIFGTKVLELNVIVLAAKVDFWDFLVKVQDDDRAVLKAAGKVAFPPEGRDVDDFGLPQVEEERVRGLDLVLIAHEWRLHLLRRPVDVVVGQLEAELGA